jgi:hypothetical protein
MSHIYKSAEHVLVWLGNNADEILKRFAREALTIDSRGLYYRVAFHETELYPLLNNVY